MSDQADTTEAVLASLNTWHYDNGWRKMVPRIIEADRSALAEQGYEIVPQARLELLPAESMTLTMASSMSTRGDDVGPNVVTFLCMTIERLTGQSDWTKDDE